MARKEITTPLDLKNLDNHNYNYDELYGLIDETDRRISENMWEEIKGANTMKMLEPVETAADLPSEATDKSLITVIEEQRVYAYVNDEWQPFSEIDLDPFSPFKDELAEIVSAYEAKIQNITQEVQNTKDSAVDSIQSTQSQSESNIKQTEQSATDAINQTQSEAESQIQAIKDEMSTQASELTALFNDSMDKLTSKQDTALAEVDSAKQEAITALENFQNTDTSDWQKFKLTNDDGTAKDLSDTDWADTAQLDALEAGEYYVTTSINFPKGASSHNAFITVTERNDGTIKHIEYRPYNSNQVFIKRFNQTWYDWEPIAGSLVTLYDGNISGVGSTFSLNDDPRKYAYLVIDINHLGGDHTVTSKALSGRFLIKDFNLGDSANGVTLFECRCRLDDNDPTQVEIEISNRVESDTATGEVYNELTIYKIEGVVK
ncbi:hypothetical protein [Staphylococcus arlettae]|uniref:hypothetical protein n=1 Tax=Staphylococcus arlettae TaxID=29378 RepID=UPI0021D14044|nr:hypothetical protein [Staphylococcus arlettae]UXU53216.1 hypothetical protein MUA71_03820 [Staphylococcus arlettae]